jgi:hypothetical protein
MIYGNSLIKNTKSQFMDREWCTNKVLSTVKITHYYGESFHEDADKVPVPHYYDDDFVDEYSNKTDYDPNQKPGQDRDVRDPKRQSPNKASSTLSEAFVVKHDIMGRSKETFETIEDAIKHINDGMKDVTAEHFILEEDGKRLVFIDISYGGNGGPAGWITWVLSQNNAKDLLGFDEEKGLFLIDHSQDNVPKDNNAIRTAIISEMVKYNDEGERFLKQVNILKKYTFIVDNTKPSYIDYDKKVVHYNEDESTVDLAKKFAKEMIAKGITESVTPDLDVSANEFEELINSPEFKKPISDTAVRTMLAMEDEENKKDENLDRVFDDVDELQEGALEHLVSDALIELYSNVAGFRLKECSYSNNKFMVEGVVHFTSGNTRKLAYTFNEALIEGNKVTLRGLNEKLGLDKQFFITGRTENKTLITESFKVAKN